MRRILCGIKPSNNLHIGNLFGSINLLRQFKDDELYLFVPDIHALTSNKNIKKSHIYDIIRYYIAVLRDNVNIHFYIQSEHNYVFKLAFMLNCNTSVGDLQRMTQFKDTAIYTSKDNINVGLLTYPTLMAADILSVGANVIPTGKDQKQHIELTRRIAEKFNKKYKTKIFKIPESYLLKEQLIYNLQDPTIKMSKSKGNINGVIFLNDTEETISNKIRKAVTDNLCMPKNLDELQNRPGVQNLLSIYSMCTNRNISDIMLEFGGKQHCVFKTSLSSVLYMYLNNLSIITNQYTDNNIFDILTSSYQHIHNIFTQQESELNQIIYI